MHFTPLTERDASHEEDLRAVAEEDRQEHALARRSEHVAMHELPTELLLRFLLHDTSKTSTVHVSIKFLAALSISTHRVVLLVVTRNVAMECAKQDHSHHTAQKQDDDQRVHDAAIHRMFRFMLQQRHVTW